MLIVNEDDGVRGRDDEEEEDEEGLVVGGGLAMRHRRARHTLTAIRRSLPFPVA